MTQREVRSFSFREHACLLLLLTLLWPVMNFEALEGLTQGYLGGTRGDPGIYVWLTNHNAKNFWSFESCGFDASFFYPFGQSLAYTDNYLFPSLLSKILGLLGADAAVSYNFALILAKVLAGYFVALLASTFGLSFTFSLFAGAVFSYLPYFSFHCGHPQLQWFFPIPAASYFVLRYVQTSKLRFAVVPGCMLLICFLSSAYYALYLYLFVGLLGLLLLLRRQISLRQVSALVVMNIPWALILLAFSQPYKEVREVFGNSHPYIIRNFSADLFSYFAAPPSNFLWGETTKTLARLESFLFPSFTLLAVFVFGLIFVHFKQLRFRVSNALVLFVSLLGQLVAPHIENLDLRALVVSVPLWFLLALFLHSATTVRRDSVGAAAADREFLPISVLLFLGLFFYFASMGYIAAHAGNAVRPELYPWMYKFLPGFDAPRGTSRIAILALMCLTIFSAWVLQRSFENRGRIGALICALIAVIVSLEIYSRPCLPSPIKDRPKIFSKLDAITEPGAVIMLPFGHLRDPGSHFEWRQLYAMHWLLPTDRRMVAGYSGKMPRFYQFEGELLESFPSREAIVRLGQIANLRYVVHVGKLIPRRKRKQRIAQLELEVPGLRYLAGGKKGNGNYLFELEPALSPRELDVPEFYLPPSTDGERIFSIEVQSTGEPRASKLSFAVKELGRSREIRREIVLSDHTSEWKRYQFTVPASQGAVVPQRVELLLGEDGHYPSVLLRKPRVAPE